MDESTFLRRIHDYPGDQIARSEYHEWLIQQGSVRATYMELMTQRTEAENTLATIDEQLEQLTREVGPYWISALYPKPGKNSFINGYTLNDGREIQLKFLQQFFTYSGLIEGVPTDKMNDKMLKSLVNDERARGWWVGDPYLIPPKIEPIELPRKEPYPFGSPERLPCVTCISRWGSRDPARDSSMDCSELSIIWFQDHFALPIAEPIIGHLLDLDWTSLAIDLEI